MLDVSIFFQDCLIFKVIFPLHWTYAIVFSVIGDISYMFISHDCKYNICSGRRNGLMPGGSIDNCGVNKTLRRHKHA